MEFTDDELIAFLAEGYEHMLTLRPEVEGQRWTVDIGDGSGRRFTGVGHPSDGEWSEVVDK